MTLEQRVFDSLATKMDFARQHAISDINYFPICRRWSREDIGKLVGIWEIINMESYFRPTNEPFAIQTRPYRFDGFPCETHQFLKWLKCLRENVDLEIIASARDLSDVELKAIKALDNLIFQVMDAIINSLPKYREASWA